MYKLTLNGTAAPKTYLDKYEAVHVANQVLHLTGLRLIVEEKYPPLYEWRPDEGDLFMLQTLAQGENNNVCAIKFIRKKANAGLKESKDYWDTHFRQEPQSLGDLLRNHRTYL